MLIYSLAIWHYELKTNAHAKACTQIVIAAFFIIIKNRETTKMSFTAAAAAAKLLQSCPTLCDPIDGSPPGSPVPGILQARILEWVAISFSNAWKWKAKGKWLSRVQLLVTPWTVAYQAPPSMGFSRQEYWSGLPLPSTIEFLATAIRGKKRKWHPRWNGRSKTVIICR